MSLFKSFAILGTSLALAQSLGAAPSGGGEPPDPFLYPLPVKHYAVIDLSGSVQGANEVQDVAIGNDGQAAFCYKDGDDIKVAVWKNGAITVGPVTTGNHLELGPTAIPFRVDGSLAINSRGSIAGSAGATMLFGTWTAGNQTTRKLPADAMGLQEVKSVTEDEKVISLAGFFGYVPVGNLDPVISTVPATSTWPGGGFLWISRYGFTMAFDLDLKLISSYAGSTWAPFSDLPDLATGFYYDIWSVNDSHQMFAHDPQHHKTLFYDGSQSGAHSIDAAGMPDPTYRAQVKVPWEQQPADIYDDSSAFAYGQYLTDPKTKQWKDGTLALNLDPLAATPESKWPIARVEYSAGWDVRSQRANSHGLRAGLAKKTLQDDGITPIPAAQQHTHAVLLVPVETEEVSFNGDKYWELWADDAGVDNVSQVPADKKYSAPQWKDVNGDGNPTDTAQGEHNQAVAFTQSSSPKVGAKFKIAGISNWGTVKIKATGSDGFALPERTATVSGDEITLPLTEASTALPAKIRFYDKKDDSKAFKINWEIKIGTSNWSGIGSTKHTVYLTLADPLTALRQETIAYIGSFNANGETNPILAVKKIWNDFEDQKVARVGTSGSMTYWGTWASSPGAENENPSCYFVQGLLKKGDGRCGAWADFLLGIVSFQGISGIQKKEIVTSDRPIDGLVGAGFYVKRWDLAANPPSPLYGVPAQGNDDPESAFLNHAVNTYDGKVYDPSYGKIYNNLNDWEDASVDLLLYKGQKDAISGYQNIPGAQQTRFQ